MQNDVFIDVNDVVNSSVSWNIVEKNLFDEL